MELIDIYLQSQTHKVLSQDIESSMLNHCYLLSSKDSFLLHEFSLLFAKELFCDKDNSPCGECVNCEKVEHSNMVDLIFYPKGEKSLMVEDINEIVTDCYITPIESSFKVYVLENFDECTIQAQNKILKTLEEPPKNVIFVLTCSNELKVLPTILSRAKKITENPLDVSVCAEYLRSHNFTSPELLAGMSDGNLLVARELGENSSVAGMVDVIFDLLINLKSSADILTYSSKILEYKKFIKFFIEIFISVLRDISVFGSSEKIIFLNYKKHYEILSKLYSKNMLKLIAKNVNMIHDKLNFNCNITGVIDQLLLDILEVKFLCQR